MPTLMPPNRFLGNRVGFGGPKFLSDQVTKLFTEMIFDKARTKKRQSVLREVMESVPPVFSVIAFSVFAFL